MSDEGIMKELIDIQNSAHLELFNKGSNNKQRESPVIQGSKAKDGERGSHNRRTGLPVWSCIDQNGQNALSISIHQSSQLDGESSYQTTRLTPMEVKMSNGQQ